MNVGNDEFGIHTSRATSWMSTPAYSLTEDWEIADLDFDQINDNDRYLEKEFFRIRLRHTFSPLKAQFQILINRFMKRLGGE